MTATSISAVLAPSAALRLATRMLDESGNDRAGHEARLIVLHVLGLSAIDLAMDVPAQIGAGGARLLGEALDRRRAGEPVARILGEWDFWGLRFALSPATLVPRPDTETLVEQALGLVEDRGRPLRLLDLGTGSGCILIALLAELPNATGLGLDRSIEALRIARANAGANAVGARALFACGDWVEAVGGPFDLILSNPPYIARDALERLDPAVRLHDPLPALDGGPDGLDAYRALIGGLARRPGLIAPRGAILFEIGYDQGTSVRRLAAESGWCEVSLARDLAGHDRVVTLRPSS